MIRLFASAVVFTVVLPALASEPGQPLDCSDWVALQPGYTCTTISQRQPPENTGAFFQVGHETDIDNESHLLMANSQDGRFRVQLFRMNGNAVEEIGHFVDRYGVSGDRVRGVTANCNGGPCDAPPWKLVFDDKSGTVLIPVRSYSLTYPQPTYYDVAWIAAISGFARAFDILQTYTPTTSSLSFRVPAMPDGLAAADHFDTYYGPLPGPIDFTQAHGLQCDFPASAPHVGDYLTVNDPLPNPSVGHGYYFVTAATYQGQTRYGRKGFRGRLSGRNPALLPTCIQP